MQLIKRTWAEIDLDILESNFAAIRAVTHKKSKILAVVKADAYGHGADVVAPLLDRAGADYFAVSNIEEAAGLRRAGIQKPILILGFTPPELAGDLIRLSVTQAVFSLPYAKSLAENAAAAGGRLKIHIKLDTGMGRIGFLCDDENVEKSAAEILKAASFSALDPEGVFTHFAVSDDIENGFTKIQFNRFMRMTELLAGKGLRFKLRHCCNSAGILNDPDMHLDMVRPGIILYGLVPDVNMPMAIGLKPALSLKSVISHIKTLPAGATVSYGMTFTAERGSRIATVPAGYADGWSRSLSNRGEVLVNGRRAKIVGRVCMDQFMADVTNIPDAAVGDTVTLIGRDGAETVTMDEIAGLMGTINYETACLIGKRVPRVFLRGARVVAINESYEGGLDGSPRRA